MKNVPPIHSVYRTVPGVAVLWLLLAVCWLASTPHLMQAQSFQSDDFNDGNDASWTRYSPFTPFGASAQFSLTNGGYRLRAAPSPIPTQLGPSRAGSVRQDAVYASFYVAVDVVDWDDTVRQAFGILARINNLGLGTTIGYAFTYERGSGVTPTSGGVDLSKIICQPGGSCEFPVGISGGSADIHLDPTKDYRFVFIGRGQALEGRVYELPDIVTPKVVVTGTDATDHYESGYNGLVIYDNTGSAPDIQPDATFDNYYATDIEPPRIRITEQPFGDYEISWPAEASVYVLQRSTALTAATWEDVSSSEVVFLGDRYAHYINPQFDGVDSRFFRMIRR